MYLDNDKKTVNKNVSNVKIKNSWNGYYLDKDKR